MPFLRSVSVAFGIGNAPVPNANLSTASRYLGCFKRLSRPPQASGCLPIGFDWKAREERDERICESPQSGEDQQSNAHISQAAVFEHTEVLKHQGCLDECRANTIHSVSDVEALFPIVSLKVLLVGQVIRTKR